MVFLHSNNTFEVQWEDYQDPESDITSYEVLTLEGTSCKAPTLSTEQRQTFLKMPLNATKHTYLDMKLKVYCFAPISKEIFLKVSLGLFKTHLGHRSSLHLALPFKFFLFQPNTPYYVYLRVTNGAGSAITTISPTILLDLRPPSPGMVIDGTDIKHDRKFQNSLTEVRGKSCT